MLVTKIVFLNKIKNHNKMKDTYGIKDDVILLRGLYWSISNQKRRVKTINTETISTFF